MELEPPHLPAPELNSSIKTLKHQLNQSDLTALKHCQMRGKMETQKVWLAWQNLGQMFMEEFFFELFSQPFQSLSSLSYKAVWKKYTHEGSHYHHGLEKTKLFDEDLLRSHCHGGFSFSAQLKADCNDPILDDDENRNRSIRGLDIKSSYGYACSQLTAIKGFATSYKKMDNGKFEKCDNFARFKSFEFLSTFYTIYQRECSSSSSSSSNIKTIYSNYSQFGFMTIKKYPLDLVIVTEDGHIEMINFDGFYAHGCRLRCDDDKYSCPSLKQFVGKKSRQELEKESQQRDDTIAEWVTSLNTKMGKKMCSYHVFNDCHHQEYQKKNLLQFFEKTTTLTPLISHYFLSYEISQDDILFCNQELTFIAIVEGFVPPSPYSSKPLLILENKVWSRSNSTKTNQGIIMTRDYLTWLIKEHNFHVVCIHKVIFYKKCKVFNDIFKTLIEKRALPETSEGKKQLLKNIVNFCSGFFGYNYLKHSRYSKVRIIRFKGLSKNFQPGYAYIESCGEPIEGYDFIILSKQFQKANQTKRKPSQTPIPLYCLITEFGKLRLSQIMCFFEKYLMPSKYKFVYSQIDNLIIITSTDTLDEAVYPHLKETYLREKCKFFNSGQPGMLTEEFFFSHSQNWKFVTGMPQNYAIKSCDSNLHKNNALSNITSINSYDASCAILKRQTFTIPQERRVHKLFNTSTVVKNFVLSGHLK